MLRTRYLVTAISAAMLFVTTVQAAGNPPFNDVVVFGDSLSDNGNLSSTPLFKAFFQNPTTLRFTTNPGKVTAELVAQRYGFNLQPSLLGGTDYAWGGALVNADTSELGLIPIPSTQHQLNDYLASTGARANGHALYSFWIGANDLFGALDVNQPAATGVATASAAATAELNQLGQLRGAGAHYILVFNIPDLGKTPSYSGTPQQAQASQLAVAYNSQLNAGLGQLGTGIIAVNAYGLLNEVIADPARYGFSNVTDPACGVGSTSLVCGPQGTKLLYSYAPGTEQSYLFADGVHPSTAAHALLAEAVLAELAAPGQISLLGEAPLAVSTAQSKAVRTQMQSDDTGADSRMFATVNFGLQHFNGTDNSPRTSSNNTNVTLGGDLRANDNLSLGAALGLSRNTATVNDGGRYDLSDTSLLAYATYHIGGAYAGAYGEAGHSNFTDVDRRIQLGLLNRTETGNPNGSHLGAGLTGGWWFGQGTLKNGPFANAEFQSIRVDGYQENGNDSTAMHFGSQHREALIGTLGWRLQGQWQTQNTLIIPYAELAWNHDSKAGPSDITTGLNSLAGQFTLAGFVPDKNWGTADVGLTAHFTPQLSGTFSYNAHISDSSQKYNAFNVGLQYNF